MERVHCKPWGLDGGLSGLGQLRSRVHRFGKTEETHFPNAKALNQVLQAGDAYILRSGGGGGFGSPLERDLAALERDVRCGYVTKEAAEKNYGAVFRPGTIELDVAATEARRAKMRRAGPAAGRAGGGDRRRGCAAGARPSPSRARGADRGGTRSARDVGPLLHVTRGARRTSSVPSLLHIHDVKQPTLRPPRRSLASACDRFDPGFVLRGSTAPRSSTSG